MQVGQTFSSRGAMKPTVEQAAEFTEAVVKAVTEAVETNSVVTLHTSLSNLQHAFAEKFAGHAAPMGQLIKSEDQRMVWGWASVSTVNGELYTDAQGDQLPTHELQKAAHKFMSEARIGKVMHTGRKKGAIVDSIVFTKELQDALGIDLGTEGWFVGYHVEDDDTWARVKKGELASFSIGGVGNRTPITKFNPNHAPDSGKFSSGSGGGGGVPNFGGDRRGMGRGTPLEIRQANLDAAPVSRKPFARKEYGAKMIHAANLSREADVAIARANLIGNSRSAHGLAQEAAGRARHAHDQAHDRANSDELRTFHRGEAGRYSAAETFHYDAGGKQFHLGATD